MYWEILKSVFAALKAGGAWAWGHKRAAGEILLAASLLGLGFLYNLKERQRRDELAMAEGLAAGLRQQITLKQNELEEVRRDLTGKVIVKRVYVPPEGYVVIKQTDLEAARKEYADTIEKLKTASGKEKEALLARLKELEGKLSDPNEIVVKRNGFTFKPGIGLDYAGAGAKIRGDFKWAFWDRYSIITGGSENGIDTAISRHVDDLIYGRPKNLEIYIGYRVWRVRGTSPVSGGIRVNLW